ncbi:MAG: hypothetical protein ACRC33_17215, partial [Gemmataceae bacterium]
AADYPLVPAYRAQLTATLNAAAATARKAGDLAEARRLLARGADVLKRLIAERPDVRAYPAALGSNRMLLASYVSGTDPPEAIAAVREAEAVREATRERWPDDEAAERLAEARLRLASLLNLAGDAAGARRAVQAGLALIDGRPVGSLPAEVRVALAAGLSARAHLASKGDPASARKDFARAIEAEASAIRAAPGDPSPHWRVGAMRNSLAVCLRRVGLPAAARAEAEAAAGLLNQLMLLAPGGLPDRPAARMRAEAALTNVGLSEARTAPAEVAAALAAAAEHQRHAAALAPGEEARLTWRKIMGRLAEARLEAGDAAGAGRAADELAEDGWNGAYRALLVHARRQDAARVRACYAKAAGRVPEEAHALTSLAVAMALTVPASMRDAKAAVGMAERAVGLAPADAAAWAGMALARLAAGDAAKAKEAIAEARKRVPGGALLLEYLSAVALAKGGDVEAGRKAFERAEKARGAAALTGTTLAARDEAAAAVRR